MTRVLLVSTYELGRQPFGLASPAAWLRAAGHEATCVDVSREKLDEEAVQAAELIAFYVPMHTATRLAVALLPVVKEMNPRAHVCFYGLYAPVNEAYLRRLGVGTILGGEFEAGLVRLAGELGHGGTDAKRQGGKEKSNLKFEISDFKERQNRALGADIPTEEAAATNSYAEILRVSSPDTLRMTRLRGRESEEDSGDGAAVRDSSKGRSERRPYNAPRLADGAQTEAVISLERLEFLVPDRDGMVPLEKYARLMMPDGGTRVVGYTEASRGCKHLCRHCPIVPVYGGVFRVVGRDVVLEDVRRQVAAGAQHVTFGDPDFFNGVTHAVQIVEELHREFPALTYDVTIKVEHLLKHREALATLRRTGCLFVTSAVESVDDLVLEKLAKNHTRADFFEAVRICREAGLTIQPTFVAFSPWTTLESYCEMLAALRELELVENVAPIQLAIRLLIPAGSRLLELEDVRAMVGDFDEAALVYPWRHADARVDALCEELQGVVHAGEKVGLARGRIFARVEEAALRAAGRALAREQVALGALPVMASRAAIPYLNEPWYC